MGMEFGLFNHSEKKWIHLGKVIGYDETANFQMSAIRIANFLAKYAYDNISIMNENQWPESLNEESGEEWENCGHWYDG